MASPIFSCWVCLSLIDAMLEMPMADVLEKVPLDRETKAVLVGSARACCGPVYQLMLAHESGEWEAAAAVEPELHLDAEEVAGFYWQAQQWAREVSQWGAKPRRPGAASSSSSDGELDPSSHVLLCKRAMRMGPCAVAQWRVT